MCAGVWVLAALLASPIAVHAQVEEWRPGRRKCYENWASAELEIAYALALDVLLFGVPLVVMGLAYSLIAVHLTRSLRFASNMPSATVTSGGSGPLSLSLSLLLTCPPLSSPDLSFFGILNYRYCAFIDSVVSNVK